MDRKPLIAGNWKMHNTQAQSLALTNDIIKGVKKLGKDSLPTVVIAPVFTSIPGVSKLLNEIGASFIELSAQNCYYEQKGAFTGEISVEMIKEFKANYIIIGHSERRQYFGETDEMINKKAQVIIKEGLTPIICCGETLEQRELGVTDSHIASQINKALENIAPVDIANSVIAYEPIWAIGTGKTCDSAEANRVIKGIRNAVAQVAGKANAEKVRILYGGSVKPDTIVEQMAQSDIDGALVGGASLEAESFVKIVEGAMK